MAAPGKPVPYLQGVDLIRQGASKASCWLLITDESIIRTRVTTLMEDAVVPEYRDFNYQRLDCGDRRDEERITIGRCIAECEELPMMADRRLVWLRDVEKLGDLARLVQYISEVPTSTVLYMTGVMKAEKESEGDEGAKKVGMRALLTEVQKHGVVIQGTLSGAELGKWLDHEFRERGLKAEDAVIARFRERVGEDASTLQTELDKLACYVGDRKSVTKADVDAITTWNPSAMTWHITDAIAKRDAGRALSLLGTCIDDDMHPLMILATLGSYHRDLLKMKALNARGNSPSSIATTLKKKEYPVKLGLETARHLSFKDLENRIDMLLRADQAAKSGKDARTVLELLILHLCR